MSHHEYNRIRSSLTPFIRLMLAIALLGLLASCGGGEATISDGNIPAGISSSDMRVTNGIPAAVDSGLFQKYNGKTVAAAEIILFPDVSDDKVKDYAKSKGWSIIARSTLIFQISISTDSIDAAILAIKNDGIGLAQPNYKSKLNSVGEINDPLSIKTSSFSWNIDAINAREAWSLLTVSSNTLIGIIDGGFRFGHEDINFSRIASGGYETSNEGVDFSTACNTGDGENSPVAGTECSNSTHGMNVSGIISAKGNNSKGISGISWQNGSYPIGYRFGSDASIFDGITYMLNKQVQAINMSLGASTCEGSICNRIWDTQLVNRLVRELKKKYPIFPNTLLVQAAGNEGDLLFNDGSPISSDDNGFFAAIASEKYAVDSDLISYASDIRSKILIVGAYNKNKQVSYYTQLPSNQASSSFIFAPGGTGGATYIKDGSSTGNIAGLAMSATNKYIELGGTSQAAPHVTGVSALVWQANPSLSASQVRNIILDNSDSITHSNGVTYKALNAEKAVRAALATLTPPTATISIITPTPTAGSGVVFQPNITASPNGAVTEYEWDFGDGTIQMGTPSQINHTYTSGGTYTVKLKIKDVKGVTNSTTAIVTVAGLSIPAVASISPVTATAGEVTTFTVAGTNLPISRQLDITFNGCANIAVTLKSANLHKFTCTPQGAGAITVDIRATAGGTVLKSQQVTVTPVVTPTTRYTYSTDGAEVIDSQTGLIWRRCSEGMIWSGVTCTGVASRFTFDQAALYATSQSSNTKAWRVPNITELESIIMTVPSSPTSSPIDSAVFPFTPLDRFWSSSTHVSYVNNAWFVGFYYSGFTSYTSISESNPIRLVR